LRIVAKIRENPDSPAFEKVVVNAIVLPAIPDFDAHVSRVVYTNDVLEELVEPLFKREVVSGADSGIGTRRPIAVHVQPKCIEANFVIVWGCQADGGSPSCRFGGIHAG
jgi:hypothetical protein